MRLILHALLALVAAFPACAVAADLTGTWKATMADQGDGVVRAITVSLKQQGSTLTGRMTGDGTAISEGKVVGDTFSFAQVGPRGKAIFKGEIVNGELHAVQSREGDDEHTRRMVFKRQPDSTGR